MSTKNKLDFFIVRRKINSPYAKYEFYKTNDIHEKYINNPYFGDWNFSDAAIFTEEEVRLILLKFKDAEAICITDPKL